jgi:hypothetical protein
MQILKRLAIGIFEASLKMPKGLFLLLMALITIILTYLLVTPFITPRKLSRFLGTYLISLVPLATCWDGVVSLLRVYSPAKLKEITESIISKINVWEFGLESTGTPIFEFIFLIGYPDRGQLILKRNIAP